MVETKLEGINETPKEFTYSCKRCRQSLFKESDLTEHSSRTKRFNTHPGKLVSKSVLANHMLL